MLLRADYCVRMEKTSSVLEGRIARAAIYMTAIGDKVVDIKESKFVDELPMTAKSSIRLLS